MGESWRMRLRRLGFNLYPSYRRSGGWITHIEDDWSELRLRLPLNWRTRNIVGTIFGGSLYAAVDPIYMMQLLKRLPSGYVVWDKAATIEFKRPATETVYGTFEMPSEEVESIEAELESTASIDREYTVDLVGSDGAVYATVEKTVHVSTDEQKRV